MNINSLPQKLLPFKDNIRSTIQDFVKIQINKADSSLPSTVSKFGGKPYLFDPSMYPMTKKDEKLTFLAQINFKEVPQISNFPKDGILQFFILNDEVWGLNFSDQTLQDTFKVLYIEDKNIDEKKAIHKFDWPTDTKNFVMKNEFKLNFQLQSAPISLNDFRFDQVMKQPSSLRDLGEDVIDWYHLNSLCMGHKIGGYPYFTQQDPRNSSKKYAKYTTLLFQMDSDSSNEENKVMWRDSGVANFFVKPDDLEKNNFSDILYNWDCY